MPPTPPPGDEPPEPFELPRAPGAPDLTVDDNGVTFLIVSAGGPLTRTLFRLRAELDTGRRVAVVATPTAAAWFDHYDVAATIEAMTGLPLRSRMPVPTEATFEPPGCRLVVSPCSLNTLTKWAAGHSDNLAVSLLCEALGRGVPTAAEVSLSSAYVAHPAATEALERLDGLGVELRRAIGGAEHPLLRPLPPAIAAALGGS
ncbi:MAG: flavoprotein [Acidimicrobiales bacterium]